MSKPCAIVLAAAFAILLSASAASAADGAIKLRCEGEARRAVAQTTRTYSSIAGAETRTGLQDAVRADRVLVEVEDGKGRIHLPESLLPPLSDAEDGWLPLTEVKVADAAIEGRFRINFANKPTFRIDRLHGDMDLTGYQLSFHGACDKDTATERRF